MPTFVTAALGVLVGTVLGGLIACCVTKWYYERAAEDLLNVASELRRLLGLILDAIELKDIQVIRDREGRIESLRYTVEPQADEGRLSKEDGILELELDTTDP